jgi:hypothetical protein
MNHLFLFHTQHCMRAIADTITTVHADHRFIIVLIPHHCVDNTGFGTEPAADTLFFIQTHTTLGLHCESINRTYRSARGVITRPANDYFETALHSAHGADSDATGSQACVTGTAGAGKHTALTANAFIGIEHNQSHLSSLSGGCNSTGLAR